MKTVRRLIFVTILPLCCWFAMEGVHELGHVLPVLIWLFSTIIRFRYSYILRFFADFALIANGAYIGCDFSITGPTDAGLMIEHGANRTILVLFGVSYVSSGLFLWHKQSRFFFPEQPSTAGNPKGE